MAKKSKDQLLLEDVNYLSERYNTLEAKYENLIHRINKSEASLEKIVYRIRDRVEQLEDTDSIREAKRNVIKLILVNDRIIVACNTIRHHEEKIRKMSSDPQVYREQIHKQFIRIGVLEHINTEIKERNDRIAYVVKVAVGAVGLGLSIIGVLALLGALC